MGFSPPEAGQPDTAGQAPAVDDATRRRVRLIIHTELTLLFLIMLCAALMARGIGFIG